MEANLSLLRGRGWIPSCEVAAWVKWLSFPEGESYRLLMENLASDLSLLIRGAVPPLVELDDESVLAIRALGSGGLLLSAHMGCHELVAREVAATGVQLLSSAAPMRSKAVQRLLDLRRRQWSIPAFDLAGNLSEATAHLKAGGVFGVMIDQDPGAKGEQTRFLGAPCCTTRLADLLWRRSGFPPVVAGFALTGNLAQGQKGELRFRLLSKELPPTLQAQELLECAIAERPEIWYGWIHRRFKTTDPEIYSSSFVEREKKRG